MPELTDAQIAREYFGLQQSDLEALAIMGLAMGDARDRIIDELYKTITAWKETSDVFTGVALEKAKEAQRKHFDEIFSGSMNLEYVTDHRRVGATHDRLGVRPAWYVGAYALYLNQLLHTVVPRLQSRPLEVRIRVVSVLVKIVLFDIFLAWDEYVARRDQRLRQAERAMIAQQNILVAELKRIDEDAAARMDTWAKGLAPFAQVGSGTVQPGAPAELARMQREMREAARDIRQRIGASSN